MCTSQKKLKILNIRRIGAYSGQYTVEMLTSRVLQ